MHETVCSVILKSVEVYNFCFNKIAILDILYWMTMFVLCIVTDFISPVPISYVIVPSH